jgi:hypothetical protein
MVRIWYACLVKKTTLYLPDELKGRIERLAKSTARSEADVMRSALAAYTEEERPAPRVGLFGSGKPELAERTEEILAEGFGRE